MANAFGLTFRAPSLLWLLLLLPLAALFLAARERNRVRLSRRFVSERMRGVANTLRPLRVPLLVLGLAAAIIALAGPQAGYTTLPIEEREANRILCIDVSNSMLAEDVGTSRLDAAKAIAARIIDAHAGRVGLVIFESTADVISPLTTDSDAVISLVSTIQAGEIGAPGSDLGIALRTALRLVESDPAQKADIVIISDGEDQGTTLPEMLRLARTRGVTVSTICLGNTAGSAIPTARGVLRDDSGAVVTTYAHPDVMQQVAAQTGGRYFVNPFAASALDSLATTLAGVTGKRREIRVPIDRFQWPLALAFAAFLCGSLAHRGAE